MTFDARHGKTKTSEFLRNSDVSRVNGNYKMMPNRPRNQATSQADDANGDGGNNGAAKTVDLHAGNEPVADHQHDGGDDQVDDRAEQPAPDGNAEEAKQPDDDRADNGDDDGGDDRRRQTRNAQTQIEPAHDHDDHGGHNDDDNRIQNDAHVTLSLKLV